MKKVSSNHPQKPLAASTPNKVFCPGWLEIIVGLVVFPAAVVAGLATAEIFRRSGSVWPAVVVHVVFNLPTIPVMVVAGMS